MKSVELLPQNSPTIIITDSGLGGLSVLALLENKIRVCNLFNSPKLIFFNAYGGNNYGYNQIKDFNKKLRQFDYALTGMINKFNPNLIMIACNTLSVIYPLTETYKNSDISILGIVEFGLELFYNKLSENENSIIILYGTPTTISSDVYRQKLIEKGISENRIINQPCYNLESEIQKNPAGENVTRLIKHFTNEAVSDVLPEQIQGTKYFAALCCTHYGYSINAFEKVLSEKFNKYEVLNPNKLMSDSVELMSNSPAQHISNEVSVVSRVEIPIEQIQSIGELLKPASLKTYEALLNYQFIPDLFELISE